MLAVCRYPSGRTYLFKCDAEWNVVGDEDYDSVEELSLPPDSGVFAPATGIPNR